MNANPTIINNLASSFHHAYTASKAGILWCGHTLKTEWIVPLANKLTTCAFAALSCLAKLLQNGPVMMFAAASGMLLFAISSFHMADRKAYEDDVCTKSFWKTTGLAAFIASIAMTRLGLISCF